MLPETPDFGNWSVGTVIVEYKIIICLDLHRSEGVGVCHTIHALGQLQ